MCVSLHITEYQKEGAGWDHRREELGDCFEWKRCHAEICQTDQWPGLPHTVSTGQWPGLAIKGVRAHHVALPAGLPS